LKENFVKAKRIALNTLEKIHIVNVEEILRCESNINYTMFYFTDGTKLLVTKTLKEFDNLLSGHNFIRVHQSHLINTNFIKEFLKSAGDIVMKDGTKVPVSTRKKQVLMDMISNF
jgi:two-component system LytT family response regulator